MDNRNRVLVRQGARDLELIKVKKIKKIYLK